MFNHAIWHTELYFIGRSGLKVFYRKVVFKNFAKFTEADACNIVKIETLPQGFSSEFCEIF